MSTPRTASRGRLKVAITTTLVVMNGVLATAWSWANREEQALVSKVKARLSELSAAAFAEWETQIPSVAADPGSPATASDPELDQFAKLVQQRYNQEVRNVRQLRALVYWAETKEDFPVTAGDGLVSRVVLAGEAPASGEEDRRRIRTQVYLPPGPNRLKYTFCETIQAGPDKAWHFNRRQHVAELQANAVAVPVPVGRVHEVEFSWEQREGHLVLRSSVAGYHSMEFPLTSSRIVQHNLEDVSICMARPNERLSIGDELVGRSGSIWHRSAGVPNELFCDTITTESVTANSVKSNLQQIRAGSLFLSCWIESDREFSVSAVAAAAHSLSFLCRHQWPRNDGGVPKIVPSLDEVFRFTAGSPSLYYRVRPVSFEWK